MRKTINPQPNLREPWLELEHARELETISSLLDAHPKLNELVLQDLKSVTPSAGSDVGRGGMSTEQVLRALLVKQLNRYCQVDVERANLSRRADFLCSHRTAQVTSCQTMKARSRSSR